MADTPPATFDAIRQPSPGEQQQVLDLVSRAAEVDGHRAVNEAGLLALRHHQPPGLSDPGVARTTTDADRSETTGPIHVLAHDQLSGAVVGYAQALWEEGGPVAALVVDPDHRRHGIGTVLWQTLADQTSAPLRVWASGDGPGARALAARLGLRPMRTLLVLGRSLSGDLPPTEPPTGIGIRTFRPGEDEDAWLAVNARAFAGHPEQGSLTRADLADRTAEPWFDPAGLLLAVRESTDEVVGFHWTKREAGSSTGEVYVIGVDPSAGIRGLGTPLLGAGLRHLREIGATDVDLYVEADNERALALYRRYGFVPLTADVMYAEATSRPRDYDSQASGKAQEKR